MPTWLPEESHAEIDVVLAVTDVLPAVLQESNHSLADNVEEQACRWFGFRVSCRWKILGEFQTGPPTEEQDERPEQRKNKTKKQK